MRNWLKLCLLAASVLVVAAQSARQHPPPPVQPIPYSHKVHAGDLELKCNTCHLNSGSGERMGFPATSVCMDCHSAIKTESPAIQKLASFEKENRKIPWVRVYQIPSYVKFSHGAHLAAGGTCVKCHGNVKELDQLYREVEVNMASCVNCHRASKASIDCTYCHEQM